MKSTSNSVTIYEPDSYPFGIGYKEWTVLWWKWLISIPANSNPAFDSTGQFCGMSQDNPNVWFLAGTFGGSAVRKLTIPHGKAILFPVINYESSFADEPSLRTQKELEERCKVEIDQIVDMSASLDGKEINIQKHRVQSGCFSVRIPQDNCLGSISGFTRMASDGYWLFLKAPSLGSHRLTSFGSCLAGKIKIGCTFRFVIK